MDGPDLALATLDELIEELGRRVTAYVLAFEQKPPNGDPDPETTAITKIDYGGGTNTAIGLASRARAVLLADAVAGTTDEADE